MSVNELQSAPCSSPLSFRMCKWESSLALSSRENNCGFVEIFMCTLRLHFWFQEYPDYVAYETPVFFEDDWLNLYLDETCTKTQQEDGNGQSDYRFVYMGPKGRSDPRFCCSFVNNFFPPSYVFTLLLLFPCKSYQGREMTYLFCIFCL